MKKFTFTDNEEINEVKEAKGFKQAVKDFQRNYKKHYVRVMWTSKAGNDMDVEIKVPMGRKKRGIGVPEPYMTPKMKKLAEEKKSKKQGYGR